MTPNNTQKKSNNFTAGKSVFFVLLILAVFSGLVVTKSIKAEGTFVDLNFIVTNQNNTPISGANISIDQDFGNGTSRNTDGGGYANFGVLDNASINYNINANGCDGVSGNANSGNGTTVNVSMNCGSTSGNGGNQNPSWPQNIQYSINDAGNGVVGYYNVKTNGNKVFNWNVNVNGFDGPGTMHVRTIGAYDDTAGSAPTTAHGFSVPASGKVDYRNPPETGSFSFSYDTRYRTCGRVQIDGSFIDDRTGSDSQLFYAIVVDYGDDCVAPVNHAPVITLVGSNPVTIISGTKYTDAGATALDLEDGNITSHIVKTSNVNTNVPGTYTVTYNVSDSQGLAAVPVTRTVVVTPANQRPVITLVGSNPVSLTVGSTYTDAGATALDPEDGNITANIVKTGTVNTAVVGTYTITYNVSDSKGLAAVPVTRTVNVTAAPVNNRPVITLVGSTPVNIVVGALYVDQGATATDVEDGNITANIVKTGTVNTAVVGTYTITYNVSDSKGLAAVPVTRTVNVTPVPTSIVVATKIVCNSESDLPNWGKGGPDITSTTASSYLASHPNCHPESNWQFQWAPSGVVNNVDNIIGPIASPWTTSSLTDANGSVSITVPVSSHSTWFREVMKSGYIGFSEWFAGGEETKGYDYSAEMYCETDVINYDNFDFIGNTEAGKTYYCVAFNALIPQNQRPVITLVGSNPVSLTVGSTYTDAGATALDPEDGNITANIVKTGTVNTAVVGTYTITYNVSDSKGLAAVPVTRTVNVVPLAPTVVLSANPINVPYGQGTTLTWVSTDATSCIASGDWAGSKALSGNEVVSNLTLNETFIITCTGQSGVASSTANVIVGPQISDISVMKVADKISLSVGDLITYTITVTNAGPNNATGVSATDILSDKLNFVSASTTSGSYATSTGIWAIGNLNNSTSTTLTLVAKVKAGNEGVTINNSVVSTSNQQDPNSGNNTSSVDITINNVPNHPPVITLVGLNPASVLVGQTYVDPGATALDAEDGDITPNIIATSTVNTSIVGSYTVTYNVKDSQGLAAVPVSRTVNVLEDIHNTPKGQITFCLALANDQNSLATSSSGLPSGIFTMNLASTTNIAATLVQTKTWNTSSFAPNTKIILQENDADCVTYSNLDLGTYYYSSTTINGSRWNVSKYNDKYNQTINNVFDFFNYSPELFTATTTDDSLRNMNADGQIVLTSDNKNQSVTIYSTYNPAPQCLLPEITSPLTASVVVNNQFTYSLTASSSITNLSVATTSLPAGLTFSTTTNTISGTPTQTGTFNIDITAVNNCGTTTAVLALTVSVGGGGGGGSSPTSNLSVTKVADKASLGVGETLTYTITVINNGPDNATGVNLTEIFPSKLTFVSATSTLGSYSTSTSVWTIGNLLNGSSTTLTLIGTVNAGTEGQTITNSVTVSGAQSDPNASNNSTSVDTTINPATVPPCTTCGGGGGGGGGNGPIVGSYGGSNGPIVPQVAGAIEIKSCYYLYDYLRKDFNNNSVEVTKLQVFLRDLEGFKDIKITGIYDSQTIAALNAFQWRYRDDVLTPWGHTAPTSYTYILTKKKVNEIYCKMAFPVNAQQQNEIDNYRNFLLSLKNAGINIPVHTENNFPTSTTTPTPAIEDVVGTNIVPISTTTNSNSDGLTTLAGVSTTTQKIASDMTATVLLAGKRFANAAALILSWPFKDYTNRTTQCVKGLTILGWLNIVLVILILLVSYLWYREYKSNRILEDVNKEIDLN